MKRSEIPVLFSFSEKSKESLILQEIIAENARTAVRCSLLKEDMKWRWSKQILRLNVDGKWAKRKNCY